KERTTLNAAAVLCGNIPGLCPECYHESRYHKIRNCHRQEEFPPKRHELVITKPRQRPAHPDIHKQETEDSQHKPKHRQNRLQSLGTKQRTMPAAEKEQRGH